MNLIGQNEDMKASSNKSPDGSLAKPAMLNENISNDFLEDILQAQLGNSFNKFQIDHRIIKSKEKAAAQDKNKWENKDLMQETAERLREESNTSNFLLRALDNQNSKIIVQNQ